MQEKVETFNKNKGVHNKPMPIYARLLDIQSELGELSKEYLKNSKYGTIDFKITDDFELEFGDVLYALLSLANELNLNANDALDKVIDKYKNRIKENNNLGSGR